MTMLLRRHTLALLLGTTAASLLPATAWAEPPTDDDPVFATYVMNRLDDMYRGRSSHGRSTMEVKTEHFTRTLEMEAWSKGKEYSLIRILSPKKEAGMATLKSGKDLFSYLNKTGRTIKITGGMLGASWMGSHFDNDDLVRETRLSEDYELALTYKGTVADLPIYVFTLTPKPDAPVPWGKVETVVRQTDLMPLRQVFYDEEGERVRELLFGGYRELGGRMLPTTLTMKPLDAPGEYTRITYESLEFDIDLDADFFSVQRLRGI